MGANPALPNTPRNISRTPPALGLPQTPFEKPALFGLSVCPTGNAALTPGFALKARFVIHAVGPVWRGGDLGEAEQLAQTYVSALRIAVEHGEISTVAFPSISTGAYKFPKKQAAEIALTEIQRVEPHLQRVVVCLFDLAGLKAYQATAARLCIKIRTSGDAN